VHDKLEAIREQRAEHLEHLLLTRIALGSGFDIEMRGIDPVRAPGELLHRRYASPITRFSVTLMP